MVRVSFASLAVVLVLTMGACSNSSTEGTARLDQAPVATNDFIPKDQNLTDCVGTVERPNCGGDNPNKGDAQMYLAFGVMLAGMAFIGWRIMVGLRRREAADVPRSGSTF